MRKRREEGTKKQRDRNTKGAKRKKAERADKAENRGLVCERGRIRYTRLLGLCVLREKPSGLVSSPVRSTSSPADRLQTKSRLRKKQRRRM